MNSIDQTNEILERLRKVTSELGKGYKICRSLRDRILDIIGEYECKGFVDYITLSSSLLFSQNYVQSYSCLQNATLYNKIKKDGYNAAGYLDGLEVVRKDYKALFGEFSGRKDVLFLVDPPYLSTDTSTYMSDNYWRLNDYLDVLLVLMKDNYVYFTSNKSQIIELCDWLVRNYGLSTPFNNAAVKTYQVKNHCCKFTDMMYYKKYESER